MRKFLRLGVFVAGLVSLVAVALAILLTVFPDIPPSHSLRNAVLAAVQRWAGAPPNDTTAMRPASSGDTKLYQCSMHPQIISDKPELCPICGMRLEPVEDPLQARAAVGERKPLFYRHPMRADVTSRVPAKDEMGMNYIPVFEEEQASGESTIPGHAPFTLSTERQQLIGVRRGKVERRDVNTEIRAAGKVAYDPMLYQTIVEYQEALAAKRRITASQSPEAQRGADSIIQAASLKLRQQGLSERQLKQIAEEGHAPLNLLLPGKSVWVYAQVYEYELELVRPGQLAEVTTPALPNQTLSATVVAIDPILTVSTRTARVRLQVATPEATLRPETFVNVKLLIPSQNQLAVPEEAVLDTGDHQIVFVVTGVGHFEPRAVQLGRLAQDYYEVLSGLAEGEEVVTSANFLIDSESRFRAAVAAFSKDPSIEHPH